MSRPRAILFDAADTLFELAEPVACVYGRFFARSGHPVDEARIKSAFRQVFGALSDPDYSLATDGDVAERAWWREVVRQTASLCGVGLERDDFESLFRGLFDHYAGGAAYRVFPETEQVLRDLKEEGFELAVVSNFDRRLHRILEELGLSGWFSVIVSSADARSRKPDSGIFRHALERIGCGPGEVVHIGDSAEADVAGARQAGIRAFLVERPRLGLGDALKWIRGGGFGK